MILGHELPAWGDELACQLLFKIIPLEVAGMHRTFLGLLECVSLQGSQDECVIGDRHAGRPDRVLQAQVGVHKPKPCLNMQKPLASFGQPPRLQTTSQAEGE